jgi:hypothetical protein
MLADRLRRRKFSRAQGKKKQEVGAHQGQQTLQKVQEEEVRRV